MKRIAPYEDELKAIQESSGFAEGDPYIVEKYYRFFFRHYCFNPDNANLNLRMSPKAFDRWHKNTKDIWAEYSFKAI